LPGKWVAVVAVLLVALVVFGVLYLTKSLKLDEAGLGFAFVVGVGTILALLK
jgi:hypothetical protein